jgi:uncharacterized membrane protein YphA (DoxX/SURF4 family)
VVSPFIFWPCVLGVVFLIIGLIDSRREFAAASGLEKLIVLGFVFVAAPLATFAGEHLAGPQILMQLVPSWMPAHFFWALFVGVALLAAAVSLSLKKYVVWSAPLLAAMFFLFVLMMDLPASIAHPKIRLFWTLTLRETAFGGGALALAGYMLRQNHYRLGQAMITIARFCIGIPFVVYGIEHFMYPNFAPGVPLAKVTPAWVPLPHLLAFLVGAVLLVAGIAVLLNKGSRVAAACVGLVMTLLTLFLYTPILAMDTKPQIIEGVNYVGDTLLFAGVALLLAMALPATHRASTAGQHR